jgi:hypothetical protein
MAKYNMSGVLAGKVMKKLHLIADTLFHPKLDEDPQLEAQAIMIRNRNLQVGTKWIQLSNNLKAMLDLIEQHKDYTSDDIIKLHKSTATFMDQ